LQDEYEGATMRNSRGYAKQNAERLRHSWDTRMLVTLVICKSVHTRSRQSLFSNESASHRFNR
jgi:hypothetical protein